jgi:hypothetical protein
MRRRSQAIQMALFVASKIRRLARASECWGDHGDFRLQRTPRNLDNAVFAA